MKQAILLHQQNCVAEIVNNCRVAHATAKRKLDFISNVKNVIDGKEWQKMQKKEGENKCMKGFQALILYITKPIQVYLVLF